MRRLSSIDIYRAFRPIRRAQLSWDRHGPAWVRSPRSPRVFNLDVHIGVIRDLKVALYESGAHLTNWSISGHNHLTRRLYKFPDPVPAVNARTWKSLNAEMIHRFSEQHLSYLQQFDGFISTYPPAFAQLYQSIGKPILVVAATRYEAPYTDRPDDWGRLNTFLRSSMDSGTLTAAANNRADSDYFQHFVGRSIPIVPSVCDYLPSGPPTGNTRQVVLGRPGPAMDLVLDAGKDQWTTVADAYGRPHSWGDLSASQEIFVIPYNVSTMTLFELATAGVPVAVPGPTLLKDLAYIDPSVLGELSFRQVLGMSADGLSQDDPNNFLAAGFLDWWLARADFYDPWLMPNVRVVHSLDELSTPMPDRRLDPSFGTTIRDRNQELRDRRATLVDDFLRAL